MISLERRGEAIRLAGEARLAYEAGDLERARGLAREASAIAPEMAGGWYWQARTSIDEYARLRPLPAPWAEEGELVFLPPPPETDLAREDRLDAIRLLSGLEDRVPEGLEEWQVEGALGILAVLEGRHREGEDRLSTVVRAWGARVDRVVWTHLALARYFQGRFDRVLEDSRTLVASQEGPALLVRALEGAALADELAGASAAALEKYDRARALARMLAGGPDEAAILDSEVLVLRAELLARTGRSAAARQDLDRAQAQIEEALTRVRETPLEESRALFARGEVRTARARGSVRRGAHEEAIREARSAIDDYGAALERDPAARAPRIRRAMTSFFLMHEVSGPEAQGLSESALADLESVGEDVLGPHSLLTLATGRLPPDASLEDWLSAVDSVLERHPEHVLALLSRAAVLTGQGESAWKAGGVPLVSFEAAVAECDRAIQASPGSATAYHQRARVHLSWGDYLMVIGSDPTPEYGAVFADCAEALERNPEMTEALATRAEKRMSLGVYRQGLSLDPAPDWSLAVRDLERALEVNRELGTLYLQRALALLNLSRLESDPVPGLARALDDCEAYSRLSRDPPRSMWEKGLILLEMGLARRIRGEENLAIASLSAALHEFTTFLPRDPPAGDLISTQILHARGRSLCALGRHGEAALDFERARERGFPGAARSVEECRGHAGPR